MDKVHFRQTLPHDLPTLSESIWNRRGIAFTGAFLFPFWLYQAINYRQAPGP